MGCEFFQEYKFVQPEYRSVIHELRDGDQHMLVMHIDVHQFKPSVMKRMIHESRLSDHAPTRLYSPSSPPLTTPSGTVSSLIWVSDIHLVLNARTASLVDAT